MPGVVPKIQANARAEAEDDRSDRRRQIVRAVLFIRPSQIYSVKGSRENSPVADRYGREAKSVQCESDDLWLSGRRQGWSDFGTEARDEHQSGQREPERRPQTHDAKVGR